MSLSYPILLAPLAPRPLPRSPSAHPKPAAAPPTHHTDKEWAAAYPHIGQMYVRERRNLRYVMQRMEDEHGFKATVQMYKKRLAKWGFYKNTRRSHASHRPTRTGSAANATNTNGTQETTREATTNLICRVTRETSLPRLPQLNPSDAAHLAFLTSIRTWSSAFFDLAQSQKSSASVYSSPPFAPGPLPPPLPHVLSEATNEKRPYDPEQLSFAFRVIAGLLDRGRGELAGRLARKAFLQAEALLQVEGPLFVWNTLEIFHSVAVLGQPRLLRMLLGHLSGLAGRHFPPSHPAVQMLRSLGRLSEAPSRPRSRSRDSLDLMQPSQSQPESQSQSHFQFQLQHDALEKGWALNAESLLSRFDPELLILYYRLVWDSDSLRPPQDVVRRVDGRFSLVRHKIPLAADCAVEARASARIHPVLDTSRDATGRPGPPETFEQMKRDSVAAIRRRSTLEPQSPSARVRVLLGVLKSRILDHDDCRAAAVSGRGEGGAYTSDESALVPSARLRADIERFHARIVAYILKVLVQTDLQEGGDADAVIGRLRDLLALREFGQSPTDPQVVHEMWLLEDLLLLRGRVEEAKALREEAYRRLERYVADVPAHVA